MKYDPKPIEKKWQQEWEKSGVFHASDDFSKPKYYALIEFPYPSGQGLHVGHPRSYTAMDIIARKRRMQGYNVLYPIGWDAFGLPSENYAIKNHVHPSVVTKQNIARFKQQLQSLGLSFDWSREINTTDPEYYKWTQWIFLQLFKHGLAYKKEMAVNWCTSCKCVLANEEVVNGVCERCGSEVVRKVKSQWMLKITAYAQRLIDDLDLVDYPDRVKSQQKNWIGRSTGAIMAVPAHDTRDWDFAKKFNLPIIEVVKGGDVQKEAYTDCGTGILVNSGILDGMAVEDAKKKITQFLTDQGIGRAKVNYKLRDWVFSRQRYWGEPIPIVNCPKCGYVPVPESELPLRLPNVKSYEPTDTGESPLAHMTDWVNTTCPHCGGPARRETDTMPQWAGSSWYFLRYMDPHNTGKFADRKALDYWSPVDWYNGGMEHTTLHLLYSRFWHKFLYDIGEVPTPEPYQKRTSHGMILGENGEKMSKSRGNVINPDDIVGEYGADTLRLYEMFIGDFEKAAPWSTHGIKGCRRFIERFWNLQDILCDGDEIREELQIPFNKAIKKVGEDVENLKFNTAIATLMSLINDITAVGSITRGELRVFTSLLNLFAPHVCEEVWSAQKLGDGMACQQKWPSYDEAKCADATIEIAVQVNGKVRARLSVAADITKEQALAAAKENDRVAEEIAGKNIVKEIYVPGKLINLVAK